MFFEGFWRAISNLVPDRLALGDLDALARLNPEKIYVENVRAVLRLSHGAAVTICESAVRQGLFARGVEVVCPDGSVPASATTEAALPSEVSCWAEEDGDMIEQRYATRDLRKVVFYRLVDAAPHA
jgi:hypothetical protein